MLYIIGLGLADERDITVKQVSQRAADCFSTDTGCSNAGWTCGMVERTCWASAKRTPQLGSTRSDAGVWMPSAARKGCT